VSEGRRATFVLSDLLALLEGCGRGYEGEEEREDGGEPHVAGEGGAKLVLNWVWLVGMRRRWCVLVV
jgi:hypothetical protein